MTTWGDIVTAIQDGSVDDDLEALAEVVRLRRKELHDREARINQFTLKPGARVRLKGLSPKYLNGLEGEIVVDPLGQSRRGKSRLAVKLDRPELAGRYGSIVRPPANCVEAI